VVGAFGGGPARLDDLPLGMDLDEREHGGQGRSVRSLLELRVPQDGRLRAVPVPEVA